MKKILAVFIILIMLICNAVSAENKDFCNFNYEINYADATVTISADTNMMNTYAIITVLNPNKDISEIDFGNKALQNFIQTKTNKSGELKTAFQLTINDTPQETVYYPVYIKLAGRKQTHLSNLVYKCEADRNDIISKLKGGEEDIFNVLNNSENQVVTGTYALLRNSKIDKWLLAKRLRGKFDSIDMSSAGFLQAQSVLKKMCVVEMFNQGLRTELFDNGEKYVKAEYFSFDDAEKENGTTAVDCYRNYISSDAQTNVNESLFNKSLKSDDELFKLFTEKTVLIGLANPKTTGYGHVEKLLSEKNAKLIGLDVLPLIDDNMEAKIAAHSQFNTTDELKNYIISLHKSKNDGQTSLKGGGGSGKSLGKMEISEHSDKSASTKVKIFNDVDAEHWAAAAIAFLKSKNIASGTSDGKFEPDKNITREEFVKLAFALTDIKPDSSNECTFSDVSEDAWSRPYIAAAVQNGIINGISDDKFGIGMYAARQDICVIIQRIIMADAFEENKYTDRAFISDYAKISIDALSSNGILSGYSDGSFKPQNCCTRAEAATIIYSAYKYMEDK